MTNKHDAVAADLKANDRIVLVYMGNDPDPIPVGTVGTVRDTIGFVRFDNNEKEIQIAVEWDNGRTLNCICPPDIVRKLYGTELTSHGGDSDFRWRPRTCAPAP